MTETVESIVLCEWLGFCAGSALKCAWHAGQKSHLREDLQEALWYVRRLREKKIFNSGLPAELVPVARRVVNSEPRGSLLAVLIHQLALPAVVRDEHLENAEYALVKAIGEIKVHQWRRFEPSEREHAACNFDIEDELTREPAKVTCEECRRLA